MSFPPTHGSYVPGPDARTKVAVGRERAEVLMVARRALNLARLSWKADPNPETVDQLEACARVVDDAEAELGEWLV